MLFRSQKLQYSNFEFSFKSKFIRNKLNEIIEKFNPDIIHTHFGYESWYFLENFNNANNIPIFISFHGFDASHKLNSIRYRKTILKWNNDKKVNFIFVSNFMLNNVQKRIGQAINRLNILYYGTDVSFFKRNYNLSENLAKKPKIFLQISSFADKKGHQFTIKAFDLLVKKHQLANNDVQLILAGEGTLKNEIVELVKTLKLENYVQFPGLVNHFEAKGLMQNANYFVHHSVTSDRIGDMEGIPNAQIGRASCRERV